MTLAPDTLEHFRGATTLCHCWRITSSSGDKVVRATDHDRQLIFQDEVFQPGLALEASALLRTVGLSPEPLDLSGALNAEGITEADLRAGVWDGAEVQIYRVDWLAPQHGIWLWGGHMTSIEDQGSAFRVQFASGKSALERTMGRVYGRRCDATFGDHRCKVDPGASSQDRCDKRFATCRDVFDNAVNFRGFPHMPGNDAVISGPGDKRDGSSRGIER